MTTETITRIQLQALPPIERMKIVMERKHTIVNDTPKPKPPKPEGAILRSEFDALDPAERIAAVKKGTAVIDGR